MARITADERGAGAAGRVLRCRPRRARRCGVGGAVAGCPGPCGSPSSWSIRSPRCSSASGTGNAERIPADRPGPARAQPHLDPGSAGLRPAGLGPRPGAALPRQGVGLPRARPARCCAGAGQIPVARFTADAHEALHAAEADLAAGNIVVIYPEGSVTRDPDWWPMESRTGVARLALTTDAVVAARRAVGGAAACTTTTPTSCTSACGRRRTTWSGSRSTSRRSAPGSAPVNR